MPASVNSSPVAELVAEPSTVKSELIERRVRVTGAVWFAPEIPDAAEERLRARARRQALVMMVVSGCISLMAVYGIWCLLRVVV